VKWKSSLSTTVPHVPTTLWCFGSVCILIIVVVLMAVVPLWCFGSVCTKRSQQTNADTANQPDNKTTNLFIILANWKKTKRPLLISA
jgi:hypothetical protein